ncbi:MAG TPA: glycosyltransferase [Azoarcus taiwanensis]|nr:glycosyltransferase [Azoarcus taiwanensis]
MSDRHPYYIVAPDYRESSAGAQVLHRLCHLLNDAGQEAYIVGGEKFNPALRTPTLDDFTASSHRGKGLIPIAVYPEVVEGNPLKAAVCVRYMLNREGVIEGNPIGAGTNDLFYYYAKAFSPDTGEEHKYLTLAPYDLDVFKEDPNRIKTKTLLYLNRVPLSEVDFSKLPENVEVLSNLNPLSLPDLAEKLKSATALYSFELSGTCTLAMLCGCPVVALTLPGYEKIGWSEQTLQSFYGGCGYALSDSDAELEAARQSLALIRQGFINGVTAFEDQFRTFIEETQHRANEVADEKPAAVLRHKAYQDWIAVRNRTVKTLVREQSGSRLASPPSFHLVVVHDGDTPQELARTLRSLAAQGYAQGFISVASPLPAPDDSSSRRLEWLKGEHVWESAALALHKAGPEVWVGLLVAGDALACHSLQALAQHLDALPQLQAIYTDEDIIEDYGTRHSPHFKPDFDPRLLRGIGYTGGLLLARNEVWQAAGGWRHLPDSDDEWDLALRLAKIVPAAAFGHLADVLYHRGSRHPALKNATNSDVVHATLETTDEQREPAAEPRVSILIPTRDQLPALQRCIETLFEQTPETPFELILVDHDTRDADALAFLAGLPTVAPDRIQVIRAHGDFNFSALINLGARHSRGEFLLLLNNDTAALHPEWLPLLLAEMKDPEAGIVAPRLVFPDGRIQHAGAVLGLAGVADYPWVGMPMDDPGYLGLLSHAHTVSAVSGAALLIRRSLFESLRGMDEDYAIAYGDIDLCVRASRAGYKCIWTPHATLMHEAGLTLKSAFKTPQQAEAAEKRFKQDRQTLLKRWLPQLARDPYYNINLSLNSRRFELEADPVLQPFSATESGQVRILAMPADDGGSGYYRVYQPASAATQRSLASARLASAYPGPIHFERLGIQTLFSQRQVDDNHLQVLKQLREMLPELRIVIDFDDLLTAVSRHNIHHSTVWKDIPRRLATLGHLCNCLTVSTAPLADAMRAYHPDIRHIPNTIDSRLWASRSEPNRQATRKLRVGWAGGISHAGDLALIRGLVASLADEVDWVFFGMCLEDMRPNLAEFHDGVPFADYPRKLAELGLDLAIAPLELNRFNECKSNLRLLEYGVLGIPVVATDILPYRCGLPVTLVDNRPQSWIRAIRERIGERDTLRRDGAALREAVLRDWTLEKTLPAWVSAWTD